MERTRWWDYVERLMDAAGWSKADVARAAGVDQSVIGRWQNKGAAPEPGSVRGVAQAFRRDVREAAIAAELFTAEELMSVDEPLIDPHTFDLSVIPDERLRDEVYARMRRGSGKSPTRTKPRRARGAAANGFASVEPAAGHGTTEIPAGGPMSAPAGSENDTAGEVSSQA